MSELQLLALDDDPRLDQLLSEAAKESGHVFRSVTNRAEFDAAASGCDAFVLNMATADYDGIDHLRHLAERWPSTPIILLGPANKPYLRAAEKLAKAHSLTVLGTLTHSVPPEEVRKLFLQLNAKTPTTPQLANEPVTTEELRDALANGELIAYFQPKVSPRTFQLAGVEALARWRHPRRGLVPPALFIPMAEADGLADQVFITVTTQALAQCHSWLRQGLSLKVAINVSTLNLTDSDLPQTLLSLASQHGVDPKQLVLEITESGLVRDPVKSLAILARLCHKEIELSIDDFGTGYSTLQQLQHIPFSELKLDRSFVQDALLHQEARVILESTYSLARKLGMRVVAEGIETEAHWDLAAQLGCDQLQGYLIARPMPGTELSHWIRQWKQQSLDLQNRVGHVWGVETPEVTQPVTAALLHPSLCRWFLENTLDQPTRRIPIQEFPFRIGRQAGLPMRLQSAKISRLHAEISYRGEALFIRDFGSTNGTFVNHQRIEAETPLKAGDLISFAGVEYRLDQLVDEEPPTRRA